MVLKFFEIFSQPSRLVGKLNQPVHLVRFAGMIVWIFSFFGLVLGHSKSESHSFCFVGLPTW